MKTITAEDGTVLEFGDHEDASEIDRRLGRRQSSRGRDHQDKSYGGRPQSQ